MKNKLINLIIILTTFIFITSAKAESIIEAGDNVVSEGEYSSLRIVAGEKVENYSSNDGMSIMAADDLILEGESSYGIYAGRNITFKETVDKDLIIAGEVIKFDKKSLIKRDAYIAASNVILNTKIGRNLNIVASIVDLSDAYIIGDTYIDSSEIIMNENTKIEGTLSYLESANIIGLDKANIKEIKTHVSKNNTNETEQISTLIISLISRYLLLVILLLIPFIKKLLEKEEININNIFKNTAIGLTLLIIVPIVSLLLVVTGVLLPVGFIMLIIYAILLYLASLLTYYIIGLKITEKIFKESNIYIVSAVGIIVAFIISLIPVIGSIFRIISFLYGIGLYINILKRNKN